MNTWQPWHESLYIDKYSQLISILEFACRTAVLSSSLIDTTQRVKTKTSDTVCVYELFVEPPYAVEEGPTVDAPTTAHPQVDVSSAADPRIPLISKATGFGHHVVVRKGYAFCRMCARYAQSQWHGLHKPCTGHTIHIGRLNRLWNGIHPGTGASLE